MASLVGKALAKRVLKDAAVDNRNSKNPFEEKVPIYDNRGRETGKFKTIARKYPTGLSPNDAKILKKVRRRAYRLDMSLFNCCGIRFGISSVIGIIPVVGDFIDCFLALMVVKTCQKIDGGLPATLRARMMFNIALDFGLGLVPLLGDIADALFRANTRNAWLLETYLISKIEAERKGHVSDPELGKLNVPPGPGTGTHAGDQQHSTSSRGGQQQGVTGISQPEPVRVHGSQQPVRPPPGTRFPVNTNGKIRRPDGKMVMSAVQDGMREVSSQTNLLGGHGDGRSGGGNGRSFLRTKEELVTRGVQLGVQAASDALRSKSAGRR